MRVAFAGTPPFAAEALRAILAAGHDVPLVLTQPDRPAGRGMATVASAVKAVAQAHGVPVAQPRGLRLDGRWADDARAAHDAFVAAAPDVLVVAAYGLILPRWALEVAPRGAWNLHASALPRWRGAAPIQRAIEAGDASTGLTLMQMDEGLDTGAMLALREVPIGADTTGATLHDALAALGAAMVVEALAAPDALVATPQPADGVTYAAKLDKAEAALDWRAPAAVLERRVRAFDPVPGATFRLPAVDAGADEGVKLWRAAVVDGVAAPAAAAPGQVLGIGADGVDVACGADGAQVLRLAVVQRAGGRRQPAAEWARGRRLAVGTVLGGRAAGD